MAGTMVTTFAGDILKLILNATPIANFADNAATSPLTTLQISLHTADPGASGTQTTSEISYTGYSRISVNRNNGSPTWTVTGATAVPTADITFGAMTAGAGGTVTHIG